MRITGKLSFDRQMIKIWQQWKTIQILQIIKGWVFHWDWATSVLPPSLFQSRSAQSIKRATQHGFICSMTIPMMAMKIVWWWLIKTIGYYYIWQRWKWWHFLVLYFFLNESVPIRARFDYHVVSPLLKNDLMKIDCWARWTCRSSSSLLPSTPGQQLLFASKIWSSNNKLKALCSGKRGMDSTLSLYWIVLLTPLLWWLAFSLSLKSLKFFKCTM